MLVMWNMPNSTKPYHCWRWWSSLTNFKICRSWLIWNLSQSIDAIQTYKISEMTDNGLMGAVDMQLHRRFATLLNRHQLLTKTRSTNLFPAVWHRKNALIPFCCHNDFSTSQIYPQMRYSMHVIYQPCKLSTDFSF